MIVQRVVHQVKRGCVREFLALAKRGPDTALSQATKRTYTSNIVPDTNVVVHEAEFENLAELEKAWAAWWADPDTPAYMEEYIKLTESSGSEVWNLVE